MGPWRPEREARESALGVQSREGSYVFAGAFVISNMVLRDCHVGLRPPRNDKSGAITVLSPTCTYRQYSAGPGCPLPYSGRYHFNGSRYGIGSAAPGPAVRSPTTRC